ncbi:potassium channel protein [Agilicoccus flavus]|uniref:potassium channel protein n=1 Tax=Agilicoccus flavus TaxID=2775968 RepID=UPI001CF6436D|nr:potassium channel protein [Agilicoccus flavus]
MNPLLLRPLRPPHGRPSRRRRRGPETGSPLRRATVPVPTKVASTDAVFLVLRRMRAPLIALVVVFTISTAGLTFIPGRDDAGNVYRMTAFDAFYFMSYTATTIGFGEVPYPFTVAQRLWVTGSIFASVTCWAYSIGALFALLQDQAFDDAMKTQRFRRKVRRIREPFFLVAGYGQAGRAVARGLDARGRRVVVIDIDERRLDQLATDQLTVDVPGVEGDARNPALLGLAGLGNRYCEGVLALTSNQEANLAVVMAVHLLRPDLPAHARAESRDAAADLLAFEPEAVINPYDDYGLFLVLALKHPALSRLVTWLMATPGTELPELREGLTDGTWVVSADDRFGREVAADLEAAGLDVHLVDPAHGHPDVRHAAGIVAGSEQDGANLSLAAHARLTHPDVYIAVRQHSDTNAALLDAFEPDSVFIPTELVAKEALGQITVPMAWSFITHAMHQDDAWGREMTDLLVDRCGTRSPASHAVALTRREAPAVARWLTHAELTVGELLRDCDDRSRPIRAVPIVLRRGDDVVFTPPEDTALRPDDVLVLAGRFGAFDALYETLYNDSAVEYVATGREVPNTWVFRTLARRRRARRAARVTRPR